MEIERAKQVPHDRHDKLSQQNSVLMSKVKYLTAIDATRSQDLDQFHHQTRREVHRMYCEMAQFKQHMGKNVMKMCEFDCEPAQKFRQNLESQVQVYFGEKSNKFNTQITSVLRKANTEIHQANAAAVDAQR